MTYCNKCGAPVPDGAAFCQACGAPVAMASSTSGSTPTTGLSALLGSQAAAEYWGKRLVAFVIDAIIVYLIIGVLVAGTALPAYFAGLAIPGSAFVFFWGLLRCYNRDNIRPLLHTRRVPLREDGREERPGPEGEDRRRQEAHLQ